MMKSLLTHPRFVALKLCLPPLLALALLLVVLSLARAPVASAAQDPLRATGDDTPPTKMDWPPGPPPGHAAKLRSSHKTASQHRVASGEAVTYTIRLHNRGHISATADVVDPVPRKMTYVSGTVTGGGVYDPGTQTLSWSDVTVPARDSRSLSFVVTATPVAFPTMVMNTAIISADGTFFGRHTPVLVVPGPIQEDVTPPVVHGLTIADRDVLTDVTVTLHISATDNVSVTRMYLREWEWKARPFPRWRTVRSSGWVTYQPTYSWTLGARSGTHFVGVWVADGARNHSHLNRQALDFASLLLPGETIPRRGLVHYQVSYTQGVSVTAVLSPTAGDPDLYAWYPGNAFWPDQRSTNPAGVTDVISFTTPREGIYLFLVHGYTSSTYDLSIDPAGGPRAWPTVESETRLMENSQPSSEGAAPGQSPVQDIVDALFECGLDPLGSPSAAGPFHAVYLPMVIQ